MIVTKDLINFLGGVNCGEETQKEECVRIIIRRLKDFDSLKTAIDHLCTEMTAGELFENQE